MAPPLYTLGYSGFSTPTPSPHRSCSWCHQYGYYIALIFWDGVEGLYRRACVTHKMEKCVTFAKSYNVLNDPEYKTYWTYGGGYERHREEEERYGLNPAP